MIDRHLARNILDEVSKVRRRSFKDEPERHVSQSKTGVYGRKGTNIIFSEFVKTIVEKERISSAD